jgi:nucleotide-binding universal stress UspA family protein
MNSQLLMAEQPRLLVGANLSEHSDEAIRQADAWSRAHGWQLLVCHVAPEARPELVRALREHVAKLTGRAPDDVRAFVATGAPEEQLLLQAEERAVEMVAIGSHSFSGLKQIFLGDVAEGVVRRARCSVLVARPHERRGRVLVVTDLSSGSLPVVALAADHASRINARLSVACSIEPRMRVVRELTNFGSAYGFVRGEYEDARRAAEEQVAGQMAATGARGETLVLDGKLAPAIVHAVGESGADLVVLSASAESGWKPKLHGDVVGKVARAAPCSVLVWRVSAASTKPRVS